MASSRNYIIVIPSLTIGGTEKESVYYAQYIMKLKLGKPVIVGLGQTGSLTEILQERGIDHKTLKVSGFQDEPITKKIRTIFWFASEIRKLNPHTIISMTYLPNLLCGLVWRLTGAKRHFWVQFSVDSTIPIRRLEKLAAKLKPRYLANGLAPAQHIAERHGLSANTVSIVRNYLENRSDSSVKTERPDMTEELHFIMVANFFPEKDHETVLRAFKLFVDDTETPKAHLHFVGSAPGISPQQEVCKALAFDLQLCGQVTFHGKVADVKPLLQKCHIGILSTRSEGVSNAILEYMLYGLPVLATDIVANQDALGQKNYKWLFPTGDSMTLYELMKKAADKEEVDEIAENNSRIVSNQHNPQRFLNELSDALNLNP